ncbi:MAG: PAS domain S-box protein [Candidatus Bathyarchaeia archaeon]
MKRRDGSYVSVEVNAGLISYMGEPADLVMIRDVTERKKVEEELRKHRDHLKELVKECATELEEKNKELEKFNKLFVGRELRIGELKKEIERLKGEKKNEG